ncbi:MAG TPA: LURP-one-related family protein [Bacteroidales bacterium]|nr:LURP-one-related family protein [Bacteroidales bacterium]HPS27072.1 LURP-one-related family protein [Bacteroidales bacterium]
MKYIVKQKLWSLADQFCVRDQQDNVVFIVDSERFTLAKKLFLSDKQGKILFRMEQKLMKLLPVYEIYKGDILYAVLKKKPGFLKAKIEIEQNGAPLLISGDNLSLEFSITKEGNEMAKISKKWSGLSDTYAVDIASGENEAFIIALVICIDEMIYE